MENSNRKNKDENTCKRLKKLSLSPALQTDVEVLRASGERQKEVLVEKEREMVRRVQAAREEELHKTAILHEEK